MNIKNVTKNFDYLFYSKNLNFEIYLNLVLDSGSDKRVFIIFLYSFHTI